MMPDVIVQIMDMITAIQNTIIPERVNSCFISKKLEVDERGWLYLRYRGYNTDSGSPKLVGGVGKDYFLEHLKLFYERGDLNELIAHDMKDLLFNLVYNIIFSERSNSNGGLKVDFGNKD